jgi:tetratricopeptide (TPR) repeat protein
MRKIAISSRVLTGCLLAACLAGATGLYSLARAAGEFEMGVRMHREQSYELAVRYLRDAVRQNAHNAYAYYYLADALVQLRRLPEAKDAYLRVLSLSPQSQAGRMARQGLMRLDNPAEAPSPLWRINGKAPGSLGRGDQDRVAGLDGSGPNYLDQAKDAGQLMRWSLLKMPLKLYVDEHPDKTVQNFQPGYKRLVAVSMDQWVRALGGQIGYAFAPTRAEADIVVVWINALSQKGFRSKDGSLHYTAGLTHPTMENNLLRQMTVQIATLDVVGRPQPPEEIENTILHELGHALGIRGHSPDPKDVMSAESDGLNKLSERDIATIRKLYSLDADVSNVPTRPGGQQESPLQALARVGAAIVKQESEVAKRPNNVNLANLGQAYLQKGATLASLPGGSSPAEQADRQRQAAPWYRKALDSFDRALLVEPNDINSLFGRAVSLEALGRLNEALTATDRAISARKTDNRPYLLKASILSSLGRKAEGNNALNEFLQMTPGAENRSEVQEIRRRLAELN